MFNRKSLKKVLWALGILLVTVIILFIIKQVDSDTTVGFLGILIGAGISTTTSFLLARESFHLQLATAALEKRLAVHQEAYARWRKILSTVCDKEKILEVVSDAQQWWENNCLYLDEKSRKAFSDCLLYAPTIKDRSQGQLSKEEAKIFAKNWIAILKPGETLVEGVALPSLGEYETGLTKEQNEKMKGEQN